MAKPTSSDITVLEKSHMMIKALTSKIASFPYDDPREKAKDQHLLATGHEFVARHLETDRINTLIAKHEEQYPPNTISCPICLEDVKVLSMYSAQYFICCGKSVCFPCGQSEGGREMKTCPMCRAPNTNFNTERGIEELKTSAERGVSSAQSMLGGHYLGLGITPNKAPTNIEEGVRFMQLAAEQGDVFALTNLASYYHMGMFGLEPSKEVAIKMWRTAANSGYCMAQSFLAFDYSAKENYTMAVLYGTLA
eukprot:scaffold27515_cov45-Cyclotella_meneghiniana.AAC.1